MEEKQPRQQSEVLNEGKTGLIPLCLKPICKLCHELFQEPRSLNCGHSFCCGCLRLRQKTSRREIVCPTCNKITPPIPVEALMRNLSLEETVENYEQIASANCLTSSTISLTVSSTSTSNREEMEIFHDTLDEIFAHSEAESKEMTDRMRTVLQLMDRGVLMNILLRKMEQLRSRWSQPEMFDSDKAYQDLVAFQESNDRILSEIFAFSEKIRSLLNDELEMDEEEIEVGSTATLNESLDSEPVKDSTTSSKRVISPTFDDRWAPALEELKEAAMLFGQRAGKGN